MSVQLFLCKGTFYHLNINLVLSKYQKAQHIKIIDIMSKVQCMNTSLLFRNANSVNFIQYISIFSISWNTEYKNNQHCYFCVAFLFSEIYLPKLIHKIKLNVKVFLKSSNAHSFVWQFVSLQNKKQTRTVSQWNISIWLDNICRLCRMLH